MKRSSLAQTPGAGKPAQGMIWNPAPYDGVMSGMQDEPEPPERAVPTDEPWPAVMAWFALAAGIACCLVALAA